MNHRFPPRPDVRAGAALIPGHRRAAPALLWLLMLTPAAAAAAGGTATAARDSTGRRTTPPVALAVTAPLHADLEALAAGGRLALPGLFARPLDRYRVARALAARPPAATGSAAMGATRARALAALALELRDLEPTARHRQRPAPAPLLEASGPQSRLRLEAYARYQAEASPGRGFVLTDSTRAGLVTELTLWPGFQAVLDLYAASVEGGRAFSDPLVAGTDIILFSDRATVALHTRYADLVFGRDRQDWGQSLTGNLLLSRSARPFTHLRLTRNLLGGRLHATIENGVLAGAEQRYVAFHRLDWQLHPRLRIAFAEGARYDADHLEPLYLVGIIPYTLVGRLLERDNEARASDARVRNNVLWDLEAGWRPRDGSVIYGELLLDDLGTPDSDNLTRLGYQLGGLQVLRAAGRELQLRGEWTRVWAYVYSVFYGADFAHQGVPLGYPLGPDSRQLALSGDWWLGRSWRAGARFELQDRGENRIGDAWDPDDPAQHDVRARDFQGVVERQWRLLGTAGLRLGRRLEGTVEIGYQRAENAVHQPGVRRSGLSGRLVLAARR